jgi:hypothetical protein
MFAVGTEIPENIEAKMTAVHMTLLIANSVDKPNGPVISPTFEIC